jgi:hypothetical protein
MTTTPLMETILRLTFAVLGTAIVAGLLITSVKLGDDAVDSGMWVVGGIVAVLLVLAAILGPTAFAHWVGVV